MGIILARRRSLADPELFVPTWAFSEDLILGSIAGLDDEMLGSVHLGHFFLALREREARELETKE